MAITLRPAWCCLGRRDPRRQILSVTPALHLQGPLLELQPRLKGYVKPGGLLLLSGILETQVSSNTAPGMSCVHNWHAKLHCGREGEGVS